MGSIIGEKNEQNTCLEYTLKREDDALRSFWSLTLKTYTKLLKFALVSILFAAGCSGASPNTTDKSPVCLVDKPDMDSFIKKITSQKSVAPGSKIYTFFIADKCEECPELKTDVQKMNLDGEVIFLNVEITWAFLISHKLGIRGVPSLVIFVNSEPVIVQSGGDNIRTLLRTLRSR